MKNRKGFTLVELLAVITIMAIIAVIATPNIISLLERSKKTDFVTDAKEFASKANYMFKQREMKGYGNDIFEICTVPAAGYKISLDKIEGIDNFDSPFGGGYITADSYVFFKESSVQNSSSLKKYEVQIFLKSCKDITEKTDCYYTGVDGDSQVVDIKGIDVKNVIRPQ